MSDPRLMSDHAAGGHASADDADWVALSEQVFGAVDVFELFESFEPFEAIDAVTDFLGGRGHAGADRSVAEADVERAFADAVERLRPYVVHRARRLADDDKDLAADLEQEAWIKLWELDPLRYDPEDHRDQSYLRAALSNRMRDIARKELRLRGGPQIIRLHARTV